MEILYRLYENSLKYQGKSGVQRFYYKDVFELLQHTYFRLLFGKLRTETFIHELKKQNRILVRREEITTNFEGKLDVLFFAGEDAKSFALYLEKAFTALLDILIKRARGGNTVFASDAEIAYRLLNIIQSTRSIFKSTETIQIKTYIALLRENMHTERVPLEAARRRIASADEELLDDGLATVQLLAHHLEIPHRLGVVVATGDAPKSQPDRG